MIIKTSPVLEQLRRIGKTKLTIYTAEDPKHGTILRIDAEESGKTSGVDMLLAKMEGDDALGIYLKVLFNEIEFRTTAKE